MSLTDNVRIETGQMYQYWGGTELAGWNRMTQELDRHGHVQRRSGRREHGSQRRSD